MVSKYLTALIFLKNGKAVKNFDDHESMGDIFHIAHMYNDGGMDRLMVLDLSTDDKEHEINISVIKELSRIMEIPIIAGGHVNKFDDIKKLLYAGASKVIVNCSKADAIELAQEGAERFGKETIIASIATVDMFFKKKEIVDYVDEFFVLNETTATSFENITDLNYTVFMKEYTFERCVDILKKEKVWGVCGPFLNDVNTDIMKLKKDLSDNGINLDSLVCAISWDQFKLNSDGMIPVVVQDYITDQVLMVAYMNEEAFETTLKLGKMTYWSRSRNELWTKGLTSGHVQYVKALYLDCDNDTILAKVSQVGKSACHTGAVSCFFQELVKKEYVEKNPIKIFENIYRVIEDRKEHPKQGSYTNYLFDNGLDKILKKVGEESTEIVIASKNPDPEEIKYEISDLLYHLMVLMVEKGIDWQDICQELARR
ncbi:bifunctional phosphoribosyl-AMP cyclohydrolase/phosphoribosyl-ATP diphosphatase HisIE [Eubacterium oxidoreducens]|uniref:Histidine biosynthesis bifunctional protein HisIE n=1 Tax=Eubacterium oxidoreducens TaxID=1732 RepID=A0A1G6AM42_EUBOX|nr:bifunctional phosphoribosyl-AMP cyclohydrolase/phosphoribosyl-ATP diphosphatase HisIE [Eubacterium oxidoreducens]SDB09432.1 phosphoribosyl-ATP pyrophosphatase /phosphoribosyl-AMP cyclohydrolase [Eubacterium oxidoreducens]